MRLKLLNGLLEDKAVDMTNETEILDRCNELSARDSMSRVIVHPQQTFEIIDFSGKSADDRLKGKEKTALAQRRLHDRTYRQAVELPIVRCCFWVLVHLCGAPRLA